MTALFLACALLIKSSTLAQLFSWYTMARQNVPVAVPITTLAIMGTESEGWPWTINDNTTGESITFATYRQAVSAAQRLDALGHNYDAGLMQINSSNFGWLGVSANTIFVTQINLQAANKVLREAALSARAERMTSPDAVTSAAISYYHLHDLSKTAEYRCRVARYTQALLSFGRSLHFASAAR